MSLVGREVFGKPAGQLHSGTRQCLGTGAERPNHKFKINKALESDCKGRVNFACLLIHIDKTF